MGIWVAKIDSYNLEDKTEVKIVNLGKLRYITTLLKILNQLFFERYIDKRWLFQIVK